MQGVLIEATGMAGKLKLLEVRDRQAWRSWLEEHHASSVGVWLVFHKTHTGTVSIKYEDSVREALCFGWVDSLIKRLDHDRYARKFTPRQPTSKWSELNRKRWSELKSAGCWRRQALQPLRPETPTLLHRKSRNCRATSQRASRVT